MLRHELDAHARNTEAKDIGKRWNQFDAHHPKRALMINKRALMAGKKALRANKNSWMIGK